jgi:succinyl-diaminopimelate desuccinylase
MTDSVEFLAGLVKIPSLNPINPANLPACIEALEYLDAKMKQLGVIMLEVLEFEGLHPEFPARVANRVYRVRKGNPTYSVCFSGHIDTVAVNAADWVKAGPFSADIIDGYMYGRGTTDMKAGVSAFIMAVERLVNDASFTDYDIYIVVTSDEEAMALNGSKPTFQWMADNGHVPDAVLVGEPAGEIKTADNIQKGSRGVIGGLGIVKGVGGHSGNPSNYDNPWLRLPLAIDALYGVRFEPCPGWPEVTRFEMTAGKTPINIPNINMVPDNVTFNWSVRFTPNYTAQQVADMLQQAVADAGQSEFFTLLPRVDLHAMPYVTELGGRLSNSLSAAAQKVFNRTPTNTFGVWASDGRFAADIFRKTGKQVEVLEAGTPRTGGLDPSDSDFNREGGMHQLHERVKLSDYEGCIDWYEQTLRNVFAA